VPGISLSREIRSAVPKNQRKGLEDYLWSKCGGKCFLCEERLNRSSDVIEVDHDQPTAEGGETSRENLNLAHLSCNRIKRNNPSIDVRPYLKLVNFLNRDGEPLRYDGCLPLFGIEPKTTTVTDGGDNAEFEFPDGTRCAVPVFSERNRERTFRYVFVQVPQIALYNDDECQPRAIKSQQVWAIYSDIQRNPLHEPPSARLVPTRRNGSKLLMFDGQHKTLAFWMSGHKRMAVKVYLDLDVPAAVRLVNSIQAKIKKLPLSPFELTAKLSDEWRHKLEQYEESAGGGASEAGFLASLPPADRSRGKQAFQAAFIQGLLDQEDFLFLKLVKGQGDAGAMTEGQLVKKMLIPLLHLAPLDDVPHVAQEMRVRERESITNVLNYLAELLLGASASDRDQERVKRLMYQSSLSYAAAMIREVFSHVLSVSSDRAFIEKSPSKPQWKKIKEAIKRLYEHPIWTADLASTQKARAVSDALSKNQDAERAFNGVGLKVGYLVGADRLGNDWSR
jgi:hypothetical protein